jgi:hypothetical protein
VNLGFAKKFESLYIAAYYGGTFWTNLPSNSYTEVNSSWLGVDKVVPNYNTIGIGADRPNNKAAILIGAANMGFRVAINSSLETFSGSNFIYSGDSYKSYETEGGTITPQIAWSMAKNLAKNGIKPYMTFDLGFIRGYTAREIYEGAPDYESSGKEIVNSQNYFQPAFGFGLGGYTVATSGGFSASVDLDYILRLRSYDNEYSYEDDNGKYHVKNINGLNNNGTLTENSYMFNDITPSISGSWSGDKLRLRFKLNLPIQITNTGTTTFAPETGTTSGKLVKNGVDQSSVAVAFAPNLRLAARWQAASRLFLNAGGRINISTITNTTTESKTFTQGVKNPNSSTETYLTTYANTGNFLYVGTTINATDNLTFELSSGVSDNSSNDINVFSTDKEGLLYLTSLLVSLKF